jgi:hypothetical protein
MGQLSEAEWLELKWRMEVSAHEGDDQVRHLLMAFMNEHGRVPTPADNGMSGGFAREVGTVMVFDAGFAGGQMSDARWRSFLAARHYAGTATITTHAGEDLPVHAAAVAEILPGVHVAALAAS